MIADCLRARVTIQTRVEVSDGHDGFTETWTDGPARIAAEVEPLVGRDLEVARQIDPRAAYQVTLRSWSRYRTALLSGRARLIWHDGSSNRTLEIIEPPRELSQVRLIMTCRERV